MVTELLRIIPKHYHCAFHYFSSVLDKRPWCFSELMSRMEGVFPPLFAVCVMVPVGDTCDRNLGHSTRGLGCSGCPFGWCDLMATLSCCPTTPRTTNSSVAPRALLGFEGPFRSRGRGCPEPQEQKGVTGAQPSQCVTEDKPKCRCQTSRVELTPL